MAGAKASNRARENCATLGAGDLTLDGPVSPSHTTLQAHVGIGAKIPYTAEAQDGTYEYECGWGTLGNGTLTRDAGSVEESSNGDQLVTFTSANKQVWIGHPASQFSELPGLCEGRLTLTSNDPTNMGDRNSANLYYTPYTGNGISLYNGFRWKPYTFDEISISVPQFYGRLYDVWAVDNAGELALELIAWDVNNGQITGAITAASNATPVVLTTPSTTGVAVGDIVTARGCVGNTVPNDRLWRVSAVTGTTITLEGSVGNGAWTSGGEWYRVPTTRDVTSSNVDGIRVDTTTLKKRLLGTIMTRTAVLGQCEDSAKARWCSNLYNKVAKPLLALSTTASWTYGTASYRPTNADCTPGISQVSFVQCRLQEKYYLQARLDMRHSSAGQQIARNAIGENNTTTIIASLILSRAYSDNLHSQTSIFTAQGLPSRNGLNFYQWLEHADAGFTMSGTTAGTLYCGISGECMV
jgi:hypothetical protein